MGPCDLDNLMCKVPFGSHSNVIMGTADCGDVGVYRLSDDIAIVQSVDYFPPLVSDPHLFGQIAAANALSDIYTIGAKPITGLNLLAAPANEDPDILAAILSGAEERMAEAGAVILGGHTIKDDTIKYGIAMTGVIHPDKLIRHDTPVAGDVLLLTKAIGTGILVTANAEGVVDEDTMTLAYKQMATLNKPVAELLREMDAHAATDITGFGLIGHATQMLMHKHVGYKIDYNRLQLLPGVEDFAKSDYYPAGTKANMKYYKEHVDYGDCPKYKKLVLNDAQTSGGLLISLPRESAEKMIDVLSSKNVGAEIIGEVVEQHPGRIEVVP